MLACACDRTQQDGQPDAFQVSELLGGADTLHERATTPRPFVFPRDHGPHPGFRTEWWYFTGNLTAEDGRELGYQLTFFRSALSDPASFVAGDDEDGSRWRTRHAYMAHFAVSDAEASGFRAFERFGRAALGLSGASAAPFRVWLGNWSAEAVGEETFPLRLRAEDGDVALDLLLERGKPIVPQGERGLSRKGPEPGNASHYYSLTRMPTTGTIRIGGRAHRVAGASWLDREWSTSALGAGLAGWDWMALQLDDGTELMLYRLRRHDGGTDPFSAGTFVDVDGTTSSLAASDFTMTPLRTWSAAGYPTTWQVDVPGLRMSARVTAMFEQQELRLAVRYWEGMVRVTGTRAGERIRGRGYLEMTGYAPPD